jgi:hypothetical protein
VTRDTRSVGELLRDADLTTRLILLDVDGDQAPAMLRTWGEVVESAAELWQQLPTPAWNPAARVDGAAMVRLVSVAQGLHRTLLRQSWPGDGPTDERLLGVAEAFGRAADLVRRFGGEANLARPGVSADIDAARMRIMHALYVGAHGLGVALRSHVKDLQPSRRSTGQAHGAQAAIIRLSAFEQLAGAYVGDRFARTTHGEVLARPGGIGRLQETLIGWDIQAHRTLAAAPTPANLLLVSRVQATVATTAAALLHAAARTGHLDADTFTARLAPTLDASQRAWTHAAGRWAELTAPASRTDPDLRHAAGRLRAAVGEITHDKTSWADPETITRRVDTAEAARTIQQALSAAVDLAHLTREVAATGQGLTGPARAVQRRANAEAASIGRRHHDPAALWVSPRDLHTNRPVDLPEPVRAALVDAGDTVIVAAATAMSAASCLHRTDPVPDVGDDAHPRRPAAHRAPRILPMPEGLEPSAPAR